MPKDTFNALSQEELILAIRRNDSVILQRIYEEGYPKMKRFVMANQGDEDQAKDNFQDAFLVFWQNVKSGTFQPQSQSAIQGYIYQIGKNKWLDWLRSSRFKKEIKIDRSIADEMRQENLESDIEHKFDLLNTSFKKLGEQCQDLLQNFYFKKKSLEEIALAYGWTDKTAKNNKYRCMEKLRKLVSHN